MPVANPVGTLDWNDASSRWAERFRFPSQVKKDQDKITFEFDASKPETTPAFWIDDDGLNKDWGGVLKRVTYTQTLVVVTTQNGCISYEYKE